ncbi:hypothetical protein LTR10_002226 [Elasticomyces elasticus]|nr:hypothetical protein LTR10_002226 [Elasticomyces elasticus]KAK4973700.1 hypothetical protein LTR42_005689 [Elasticomyces elasticus]
MKNVQGIHIQLRGSTNRLVTSYHNAAADDTPSAAQGLHITSFVQERPGDIFQVKFWFDEHFKLGDASGVAITITCGHGDDPPGGFQHRQCFWLRPGDISTPTWEDSYKTWQTGVIGEPAETYFTFPVPNSGGMESFTAGTHEENLETLQGSVVVSVSRGNWPVGPNGLPSVRSAPETVTEDDDVRSVRLTTDPPDLTQERWNGEPPIAIAPHWYDRIEGDLGQSYTFEFKNLDVSELFRAEGRFRLDTGELAAEDSENSDVEYNPNKHRKRKRGADAKGNARKQRQNGTKDDCAGGWQACGAAFDDQDQDDEELLPIKTEACDDNKSHGGDRDAAGSMGRLSLERKIEPLSRAVTPVREVQPAPEVAPGTPEEENLYTDSRHPSVYGERDNAQSDIVVQTASQPLAIETLRQSSAEDRDDVDDDANAGGGALSQQQGNMSANVDLTIADAEESVPVKQESGNAPDNALTAESPHATGGSPEDEENLEIRAEELRLQREDVRIQREQLEVRRRQHAMQKKKREGN